MNNIMILNQGNTYNLTYSIKNLTDGSPKDLTGTQELKFALAKNTRSPALIELDYEVDPDLSIDAPATAGVITVVITAERLNALTEGRYYFEVWHKNSLGEPTTLVSQPVSISSKLIKA